MCKDQALESNQGLIFFSGLKLDTRLFKTEKKVLTRNMAYSRLLELAPV